MLKIEMYTVNINRIKFIDLKKLRRMLIRNHSMLGDVNPDQQTEKVRDLDWLRHESLPLLLDHMEHQLEMDETVVSWCRSTKAPSAALSRAEVQVVKLSMVQINCCVELTTGKERETHARQR